ncbi:MAG: sugar phosphate isomerase/epimerase [Clostridiales Family XIII bacterium]|jgi:inosose dehydratase|nr:sugar phosphate isomerase/epimerase [Clostridiales Family XIII bacterium]
MSINISIAPCCWGIDDVTNPNLPPWKSVLNEAHEAGYKGIELGPYGYLPLADFDEVTSELERNELIIVAGTIFSDMKNGDALEQRLKEAREICEFITKLPSFPKEDGQHFATPYLTVMDWGHDERDYAAGHPDTAPRLSQEDWDIMVNNFTQVAKVAKEYGIRAVIHPHAGGYIEFEDEIDGIAEAIPADLAGFVLDTGHLYYAGLDPVAWLRKYADRLDYIHFKDIDIEKYHDVLSRKIRFFDGCAEGVMCPIGQGVVDYEGVLNLLKEIDYHGFITIEQEKDPRNADKSLEEVKASLDYLKSVGY